MSLTDVLAEVTTVAAASADQVDADGAFPLAAVERCVVAD